MLILKVRAMLIHFEDLNVKAKEQTAINTIPYPLILCRILIGIYSKFS